MFKIKWDSKFWNQMINSEINRTANFSFHPRFNSFLFFFRFRINFTLTVSDRHLQKNVKNTALNKWMKFQVQNVPWTCPRVCSNDNAAIKLHCNESCLKKRHSYEANLKLKGCHSHTSKTRKMKTQLRLLQWLKIIIILMLTIIIAPSQWTILIWFGVWNE